MQFYDVPPHVTSDESNNISDLLADRVAKTPDLTLFARSEDGVNWRDVSAKEFELEVIALAKGLIAAGIQPGQAVAIMCRTRYEWTLIDFAIWYVGALSVPIYETSAPAQIEWILSDSDSVAIFVEHDEHEARFNEISANTPLVRQLWKINAGILDELVKLGKDISNDTVEQRRHSAKLHDLATIIYTSGTTGQPKGCELTHQGFVELSRNATIEIPEVLHEGKSTLLFLPLAHVLARFVEVICVHAGVKIGHQPDAKNVAPAMVAFRPHFLLAVPRVFEKVYNAAEQKAEAGGKGQIFRTAAQVAIEYSKAVDEKGHAPFALTVKFHLFNVLVYKKIRAAMGGRVEYAVSGGAPLGARLGHFFKAIGLTVLEGYGLTETTAPALIGRPKALKIGKVGRALPGTGVAIAEDGEILLRGSNIMRGYWRNEAATKETMQGDWFKTGDIGSLDEDGFLTITGRKKELIVTAGGKNVSPAALEDPLRANPLIGQVVVIGDQKPFVSALVSLDPEMLSLWLGNNGEDASLTMAQASKSAAVHAEIQRAIDAVNKKFSKAESIRKFAVLESELSEESGHLTPSLKVKRAQVLKDFAPVVDSLYETGPATGQIPRI